MPWKPILPAGRPLLIAAWMLALCSCSTTRSAPATPPPTLPPAQCLTVCPPVPELTDGSLPGLRRWVDDLLHLYHDCRRAHTTCAADLELTTP